MTVWYGHLPIARSASLTIFAPQPDGTSPAPFSFPICRAPQPVPHAWLSSALASSRVLQNP
jgi:hypothetical protein